MKLFPKKLSGEDPHFPPIAKKECIRYRNGHPTWESFRRALWQLRLFDESRWSRGVGNLFMSEAMKGERVTARLFIGVKISSEMRMHLGQSTVWHNVEVDASSENVKLTSVRHNDSEYIGCYCQEEKLSVDDLPLYEKRILAALRCYCSKLQLSASKLSLFTQLFVR